MADALPSSENPYLSPRILPVYPPAESNEGDVEGELQEPIRVAGELSFEEGKRVNRLVGGGPVRQFVLFALLGVMLFFLMNLAVRESMLGFGAGIPAAVFVAVVLLGCLVLVNVAPQVHLRRHWRQRSGIFQTQQFEFTEEALVVKTDLVQTCLRWQAFSQYRRFDDVVLIYLNPPTSFFVVPRSFFETDKDWQAFRGLVERRVTSD